MAHERNKYGKSKKTKELTIEELLVNAKNALKNNFDKVVSGVTTLNIIKFIKYVDGKEKYVGEVLGQLLEKYGLRDDNGDIVKSEDGKGFKLKQELISEYIKASVELERTATNDFEPTLTLDEISKLNPTIGDMYNIMPILKEE